MLHSTAVCGSKTFRWLPLLGVLLLAACAPMTGLGAQLSPAPLGPKTTQLQVVGTVEKVDGPAVTVAGATFALAAGVNVSPALAVGKP